MSTHRGDGLLARLSRPVDGASLAAFRIIFGLAMAFAMVRYTLSGWVDEVLVQPRFFFKFSGFEWVPVFEPPVLYELMITLSALAVCIALGVFYRVTTVLFWAGFTLLQLMDVTNYLNHYYLVVLLSGYLVFLPAHHLWSVDAWRRRRRGQPWSGEVPAWTVYLIRFQLSVVYVHAGLAKVGEDWLTHGQPMGIWMASRADLPIIGGLITQPWAPVLMSWAGCLYDMTIPLWMSWRRTRRFAYVGVLVFHGMTQALFDIGMFPTLMVTSTLIFFPFSWPRSLLGRWRPALKARPEPTTRFGLKPAWMIPLCIWCGFQALWPLRSNLYPGHVLWDELGMRFSWRVMIREKHGSVTYHVTQTSTGRVFQIDPKRYLEWRQVSEMSGQPDLIIQLAHHIHDDCLKRGLGETEVRAEAWVSLNGRPPALLMNPDVDLIRLPDTWPPAWITPHPDGAPLPASTLSRRSSIR
ncbi:MAG: HTTM domain-containing protein [Bradymonadia bacterium]